MCPLEFVVFVIVTDDNIFIGVSLGLHDEGCPTLSGEEIDLMDLHRLQLAMDQVQIHRHLMLSIKMCTL